MKLNAFDLVRRRPWIGLQFFGLAVIVPHMAQSLQHQDYLMAVIGAGVMAIALATINSVANEVERDIERENENA